MLLPLCFSRGTQLSNLFPPATALNMVSQECLRPKLQYLVDSSYITADLALGNSSSKYTSKVVYSNHGRAALWPRILSHMGMVHMRHRLELGSKWDHRNHALPAFGVVLGMELTLIRMLQTIPMDGIKCRDRENLVNLKDPLYT